MANSVQNYDFKMHMEGVRVPFKSAMITCTPSGTEANINLMSNKLVYQLKPKTSVQIFYRDWIDLGGGRGWRLMFDGALSGYFKVDQATEGRGLGIICRDFRMDIRRAPAALAWQGEKEISGQTFYERAGLYQKWVDYGHSDSQKATGIETYDKSGLNDLWASIKRIAQTSYGKKVKITSNGGYTYKTNSEGKATDKGEFEGGFYLDAVVRGMWTQAVGGTAVSSFINKRARIDKRFMIPKNDTGYNFWNRQSGGLEAGNVLMGNSRFSSLEAAIMRLAGLFSVRVYSCSTPNIIALNSSAADYIIDKTVKKFLVDDNNSTFGPKYVLNETMLLPPLEFTAPPNSNIILPPMFDRIQWQYDIDSDFTRGYFKQVDTLSTPGNGPTLSSVDRQIPNALFNILKKEGDPKNNGRLKPPLTLDERYQGVNVYQGSVELILAQNDASKGWPSTLFSERTKNEVEKEISKVSAFIDKIGEDKESIRKEQEKYLTTLQADKIELQKQIEKEKSERDKILKSNGFTEKTQEALDRHALIKFLNAKYSGRVATVDMQFNPYIMCGFPAAVVADDEAYGDESMKTIVGSVQVIKHSIAISPQGGSARTSVTINNARYVDEPTAIDDHGNPLWMKATDPDKAEINDSLDYVNTYNVPEPKARVKRNLNDKYYDLDETIVDDPTNEYVYAKDFLTLTKEDIGKGARNGTYLDEDYWPNRISKFYTEVFQRKEDGTIVGEDHFMISKAPSEVDDTTVPFIYDTIHEGLDNIKINRKDLMSDYHACVRFISRNVCSADAFFQGISECSILTSLDVNGEVELDENEKAKEKFKTFDKNYIPTRIEDRYYGVTSDLFDSGDLEGLDLITKAGQFSSIRENMPITSLIQERRDAVEFYLEEIGNRVQGVQFANK